MVGRQKRCVSIGVRNYDNGREFGCEFERKLRPSTIVSRLLRKKYLTLERVDAMLQALADGTRRNILALVWKSERTAGEISSHFRMSRPGISQHIGVLLKNDLLVLRRAGTRRLYRANRRAIARLRAELGSFWDMSLAQLENEAEGAERRRRGR